MDWANIFIHDTTWTFAAEIVIRAAVMFSMVIVFLRFTGKRGVRQLSIFELTIILSLGSIAGDPMFTEDLPIIQAVIIMSTVIGLYRLCTWVMMKYQPFEDLIEGKPIYIVEEGQLVLDEIKKNKMSHDEFFAEMRQQSIEHLGQVRTGLLETDGKLSILVYGNDEVRHGLPLFPKQSQAAEQLEPNTHYACMFCGYISYLSNPNQLCIRCKDQDRRWTKAMDSGTVK